MFSLYYPPEFELEDMGFVAFFAGRGRDDITLVAETWQQTGATPESVAAARVEELTGHESLPAFDSITVADHLGEPVSGVQALFSEGGEQFRIMVLVRPETLLANMLPDDVVYQLVARAPAGDWPEWESAFDIVFESFMPHECGGV